MPEFAQKVEFEDVKGLRFTKSKIALWCQIDGKEVCIPQSQIDDDSEVWEPGQEGKLVISEWIATQKGLV